MQIPSFLYGLYRDVQRRCKKNLTAFKRGAHLADLVDGYIDTREAPGLLVLQGPSSLLGGSEHFHCFALMRAFSMGIPAPKPPDLVDRLREESLQAPWSLLGLLGQDAYFALGMMFFGEDPTFPKRWESRHLRFLDAIALHWDELDAEGPRYTKGLPEGKRLWELPTNIKRVLAYQGLPIELVRAPLPPGSVAELISLLDQHSPTVH